MGLVVAAMLLILAVPVAAQAPERQEAFVWATTAFTGAQYESNFYPPGSDTVYLMAGYDHVIAPRRTMIYYWPITNRILADWLALNEVVEGELVVQPRRGAAQTLALTDYVIQFDGEAPDETLALYAGDEAHDRYAAFDEARKAYAEALHENYRLQQLYRDALDAAAQAAKEGKPATVPEGPPPEPPAFTWYSTDIKRAFVVNLPPGDYTMHLRLPDGQELPGSRRKLHVYAPRRTGVGYKIMPETKWTVPEESNDPENVIYAAPGSTLYLQPFQEIEVNELAYGRTTDAQQTGLRKDRHVWVHTYPYPAATLQVLSGGQVVEEVALTPYFVRQLPGASLGYQIERHDPEAARGPSFTGYAVQVRSDRAALQVRLVDADGAPVPGSQREIRPLRTPQRPVLYGFALLPLLIGATLLAYRRTRLDRIGPTTD
ncbi:MAG: hypothetical protein D6790_11280 [Caldilineae bacterium]|nr:MAG: hypothetical protein D6790_11280 [Caldilineae bacterium]